MSEVAAFNQLSLAERQIAFVTGAPGLVDFEPESPAGLAAGPHAFRCLIRVLQTLPDNCNLEWSQQIMGADSGEQVMPFTPELGKAKREYDDGSSISALIRSKSLPYIPRQFDILASLAVTAPGDQSRKHMIDYEVGPEVTGLVRSARIEDGSLVARIAETASQLVETGLGEDDMERYLLASMSEAGQLAQGQDPGAEFLPRRLRASDATYRSLSDGMRAAAIELPPTIGVGAREVAALGRLLFSL